MLKRILARFGSRQQRNGDQASQANNTTVEAPQVEDGAAAAVEQVQESTSESGATDLFPPFGVALHVLQDLAALPEVTDDMTTADVCFKVIIPLTKSNECAYHEYLTSTSSKEPGTGRPSVGLANMFLSHAWGYKFKQTVDAITNACNDAEKLPPNEKHDMYLWMDIVSVNQHQGAHHAHTEHFWNVAFTNAIGSMKRTFFVFDQWKSPWNMKRVWCLWEIMTSVQSIKNESVVCLFSDQESSLRQAIYDNNASEFANLIDVDARNAQATVEEDRLKILGVLEHGMGFNKVNMTVRSWLLDWLANQASNLLRENHDQLKLLEGKSSLETENDRSNAEKLLNVYEMVAYLIEQSNRDTDKAVDAYKRCIALNRKWFQETNPDRVVTSTNNLVKLLIAKGKPSEALDLFDESGSNETIKLARVVHSNGKIVWLLPAVLQSLGAVKGYLLDLEGARAAYEESVDVGLKALKVMEDRNEANSSEYRSLQDQVFSVQRNLAMMLFASDYTPSAVSHLEVIASRMKDVYGESDWRYLKMKCIESLARLRSTHPDQLQTVSVIQNTIQSVSNVLDYIELVVTDLDSNSNLKPDDAWGNYIRLATYLLILQGRASNETRLKVRLMEIGEKAVQVALKQSKQGEEILQQSTLGEVCLSHAITFFVMGYDSNSVNDLDLYISLLDRAAGLNKSATIRAKHVQELLVHALRQRAALQTDMEKKNTDTTKANECLKLYGTDAVLAASDTSKSLGERRTQLYIAMMNLNPLGAYEGVLEAGLAASAIDEHILSKDSSEWSDSEKEIMTSRHFTQYHPGWLCVQMGQAYDGLGEFNKSDTYYSRCLNPNQNDLVGNPPSLSDNPFVILPAAFVKAKAGKDSKVFGAMFAQLLTRFGYTDQAIGQQTLTKWIMAQLIFSKTKLNTNQRNSSWTPELQEWCVTEVMPVLMRDGDGNSTIPPGSVLGSVDGQQDEIAYLAVLLFRIKVACDELNKDNKVEPRVHVVWNRSVKWIEDKIRDHFLVIQNDSKDSIELNAREAHYLGNVVKTVCQDNDAAIHWWNKAWLEVNRLKHSSGMHQIVFTPESLLMFSQAMYNQHQVDNLKRVVSVLEVGCSTLLLSTSIDEDEFLVRAIRFLVELYFIALKDYTKVVHWCEILAQPGKELGDEEPNSIWVDVRFMTMLLMSYKQVGDAESKIDAAHEVARKHHMFVNVLHVFEQFL